MAGLAHSQQAQRPDGEPAADEATSAIDKMVAREIDSFTAINDKIVAQVMIKSNHSSTCQSNSHPPTRNFVCVGQRTPSTTRTQQFDLHNLWLDNKFSLPLHYAVYIAEVG